MLLYWRRILVPSPSRVRVSRFVSSPPLRRYREVAAVLVRYGFLDVVEALHLRRYLSLAMRLVPRGARIDTSLPRAVRLRLACEALGPVFVKFGQALSLRGDLVPSEIAAELAKLQDAAAPLDPGVADAAIEAAFGRPLGEVFASFESVPLASASMAQVHRAVLATGEQVVVKVRRPGIERVIASDVEILRHLAQLLERHLPSSAVLGPSALVEEFARSIRVEQDLVREGRSIERCARNFAGDAAVRVPAVFWAQTTSAVLTLEYLEGLKVSDLPAMDGLDQESRRLFARRGADAILRQVLVHGFFHADPHPGNLLILPGLVVGFIDFGIVGRLDETMRRQLTKIIRAVWQRDVERLAQAVTEITAPLEDVDLPALTRDVGDLVDTYADVPIGQLSMAEVLSDVVGTAARHHLMLPPDLMLLIKSIVTIESVGTMLDPDFRMVEYAAPFAEQLQQAELAPEALASRARDAAVEMASAVRALPQHLETVGRKIRDGRLEVQFVHRNLEHFITEMDRSSNRLSIAIVIAALVIGSSFVMQAGASGVTPGYSTLGLIGFFVAGVLGIGLVIGVFRSGRL